eukprot:c5128_g1_i1 orf=230-1708(+)
MSSIRPELWWALSIFTVCALSTHFPKPSHALGVNWGIQASHPLPPDTVVQLLKANGISKVKLFDSNSSVLDALANSNIEVMVGLPNDLLLAMTDQAQATAWVTNNVGRYMHAGGVNIKYVAVGNEPFLKSYNNTNLNTTYPALVNIQRALHAAKLGDQVKATVPMNADVIQAGDLPSESTFRPDISDLMTRIVTFLSQNGAPFTINIYPFISLYDDPYFPVDFAFFDGGNSPVMDGLFAYHNVFDASYDSLLAALAAAGPFGTMSVIVGEIGWPTDGDVNANVPYAKKFNQGFLNHVMSKAGTPRRPNSAIQFYLFSLIDEDLKSIAPGNFERHWGIFQYDGRPKYPLSLTGVNGQNLVQASGVQYLERQWCIYNPSGGDQSTLGDSITYACTFSDCTSLGYGSSCNPYLDLEKNASYAFNNYFQRQNQGLGTCDFNGLGQVVSKDPSVQACEFMIQIATPEAEAVSDSCKSISVAVRILVAVMCIIQLFLY